MIRGWHDLEEKRNTEGERGRGIRGNRVSIFYNPTLPPECCSMTYFYRAKKHLKSITYQIEKLSCWSISYLNQINTLYCLIKSQTKKIPKAIWNFELLNVYPTVICYGFWWSSSQVLHCGFCSKLFEAVVFLYIFGSQRVDLCLGYLVVSLDVHLLNF